MSAPNTSGGAPRVTLRTSMGSFAVELYVQHAPRACRNFVELVQRGYYDGTVFHRVVPNFIVQGGDPTGTGRGGEAAAGGMMEDEVHPGLFHTGAGVLAMANAGPHTNGSQFYLTLAPCPTLDGKHTIFGRVVVGMETVKRLGAVVTDANDRPTEDVVLLDARLG